MKTLLLLIAVGLCDKNEVLQSPALRVFPEAAVYSLPIPADVGKQKIIRGTPLFSEAHSKLFIIENRQLVSYELAGNEFLNRTKILEAATAARFWSGPKHVVIACLSHGDLFLIASDGQIIRRIAIGDAQSLSVFDVTSEVIAVIGSAGCTLVTDDFRIKKCQVRLESSLVISDDKRRRLLVPVQVNESQESVDGKYLIQELTYDPDSLLCDESRAEFPALLQDKDASLDRNVGLRFVGGPQNSTRQVVCFGNDQKAQLITPPSWDSYLPSVRQLGGNQALVVFSRRTWPPGKNARDEVLLKLDTQAAYSRSQLCMFSSGQIFVIAPCFGGNSDDYMWFDNNRGVAALGPAPMLPWDGREVLTLIHFRVR